MNAVKSATSHWPASTVHFEAFSASERPEAEATGDKPFEVLFIKSGLRLEVPESKSIVTVQRENGIVAAMRLRSSVPRVPYVSFGR